MTAFSKYISLFISGVVISWGPCFFFCGSIVVPFLASLREGFLKGLKAVLIFSFFRALSYTLLSAIFGGLTRLLIGNYYKSKISFIVYLFASFFIIFSGVVMLTYRILPHQRICQIVEKKVKFYGIRTIVFLGLLLGFLPCFPLLSIFTYIALNSINVADSIMMGLSFGLGTLVSPLLFIIPFFSQISLWVSEKIYFYRIFHLICAGIFIFLGIQMLKRVF